MFSLLCAVWQWFAASADILLDLAVSGRAANNAFVIAIVSGLAIVRVAAVLLFLLPGLLFLLNLVIVRDKKSGEILRVRVVAVVLIIAAVIFEIWAVPGRNADTETAVETRIETERG